MPRRSSGNEKMTFRQQLRAIKGVAKISFRAAPGAVMFKLVGAVVGAALPFVTTYFAALTTTALAEAYGGDADAGDRVIVYVLITAGLGFFMTIWQSIDQYIQAMMRYEVESKVSDRMYEHFMNLDFWRYDDKNTADLYDRSRNFTQFFAYIFDRLAGMVTTFLTMIGGVAALVVVNWWLALFLLVAIIPGVVIQFKLSKAQIRHWNQNVETRRAKNMIEWNMLEPAKIAELRLYGIVRRLLTMRQELRTKDEKTRIEFERRFLGIRLVADGLEVAAEVGSLIWITLQIIAREQPVGQFLYVQQVVSRALRGAGSFVSEISSIDRDVANLFDYQSFMELEESTGGDRRLQAVPKELKVAGVSFSYPQHDELVLDNVSMTIRQNQHIAIVGENGAGKSTLVKLITGMYKPTSGQILIDGLPLQEYNVTDWHRQIAVLQQDFIRFGFATVRDNVMFGDISRQDDDVFRQALVQAEASDFTSKLPKGVDSYVDTWMEDSDGVNGVELSGGQWQRLALARNFYRDAPIIILDEPTSAIDALAESRIFEHLFAEKDKTIITISHRLTTVEKADFIYVMQNGKIAEQGKHAELVEAKGVYYKLFKAQIRK